MTATLQPTFPATPKRFERMMKRNEVLAAITRECHVEFDDDDLRVEVEDHRIFQWVFDISTRGARGQRAEWLFFPLSVEQAIARINNPRTVARHHLFDEVMRWMLPHGVRCCGSECVKGPMLEQAWNCSTELVISLIDAGHLQQFGASEYRRGRGGEAIITISSIETFLLKRRVEAAQA